MLFLARSIDDPPPHQVNFLKGCIVGGIIRGTTTSENKLYFQKFGEAAAKLVAAGGPSPSQMRSAASSAMVPKRAGRGRGAAGGAERGGAEGAMVGAFDRQVKVAVVAMTWCVIFLAGFVLRHDVAQGVQHALGMGK